MRHYRSACAGGDPRAAHNLAVAHLTGDKVAKDPKRARELLETAANGHVGQAHYHMSLLYEKEGKVEEAHRSLMHAARVDTPVAQYNVAMLYLANKIEAPNRRVTAEQEATKWFTRAAKLGMVEAQLRVAYHFMKGIGCKNDEKEATKWFQEAAAQGNKDAQFILAFRYAMGLGLPEPDISKAREIVKEISVNGSIFASSLLGTEDPVLISKLSGAAERSIHLISDQTLSNVSTKATQNEPITPINPISSISPVRPISGTKPKKAPLSREVPILSFRKKE